MRFIVFVILLFSFLPSKAKEPATHVSNHVTVAARPKPDSAVISMHDFIMDTLRSDSFYRNNYAMYLLPKKQLSFDVSGFHQTATIKPLYRRDLVFYFIIILVLLLLFIKFNFTKLYNNALASFFSRAANAEIINDKYSPRWLFILFANLFFILVIALWFYRNFITLEPSFYDEKFEAFGIILGILAVVYLVKIVVHLFLGAVFKASEAIVIYILNISVTNLVCGIIMLIANLLILYSPWHGQSWLLNFSLGILILFLVLRYVRGLMQTTQYFKYNFLYLILYLCALEIAPWFLIIKYLNDYL